MKNKIIHMTCKASLTLLSPYFKELRGYNKLNNILIKTHVNGLKCL